MKIYIMLMLVLFALTISCDEPDIPVYIQENLSEPVIPKSFEEGYVKCTINEFDHYISGVFIYHIDSNEAQVIYTPIGEYYKPNGYERWQLRLYRDKNDSMYNSTWNYINAGELPNKDPIECMDSDSIPSGFKSFINTHKSLFLRFEPKEVIEFD